MYRSHNKPVLDLDIYEEVVGIILGYALVDGMAELDFEPHKIRLQLDASFRFEELCLSPGDLVSILSTESGVRIRCLRRAKDQNRVDVDHKSRLTKGRSLIGTANGQEGVPNLQRMIRVPTT